MSVDIRYRKSAMFIELAGRLDAHAGYTVHVRTPLQQNDGW